MTERELAHAVSIAVKIAQAPLLAKIAVLEARPVISLDVLDGLKEINADLRARLLAVEGKAAIPGPAGPMGATGAQGEPGPAGPIGPAGERGERGERGLDGKDGAPGLQGKDGADGRDGKDGAVGLEGKAGPEGPQGRDGRDGKDGAAGLNGRDGANGLDGKDGAPGLNGRDGANGLNGKDGAPGLSPDDFDFTFNADTRELSITLSREGKTLVERSKVLDGMRIYRGVYEAGRTYEKGDVTSWDGSEWTAMAQTKERPGNGSTPWKLTVKHGERGKTGPEGKPGRDGRDLTQMDEKGRRW